MKMLISKVQLSIMTFIFISAFSYAENKQWVEWIVDVETEYANVDNLNYSAFSNDQNDDNRLAAKAVFGRFYQFSGNTRMHIAVELAAEKYNVFTLMNNTELAANLGFRHKFGLGHKIPYLLFNTSYSHKELKSREWSHDTFELNVEVGKHFTNNLSLAASLSFSSMDGEPWDVVVPDLSTEVFDQSFWSVSVYADYILSDNWLLSLGYERDEGDFHSACTGENVNKALETMAVKAITSDAIFGGCVYQIDGSRNIYSTNLSYALSNHSALNLSVELSRGNANSLSYHGRNIQVSYNYRY